MPKTIKQEYHLHLTSLEVPDSVKNGSKIITVHSFVEELRKISQGREFDFVAIESPWADRSSVHTDYVKVRDIYSRSLPILISYLKKLNFKRSFNDNFWKTLLSPWLIIITMNFFNKQKIVDHALKIGNIKSYSVLSDPYLYLKFYNDEDYASNLRFNENWNFAQYTIILENMQKLQSSTSIICDAVKYKIKKNMQAKFLSRLAHATSFFIAKNIRTDVLFYGSFFDRFSLFKVQISLKQFPLFFSKMLVKDNNRISIDRTAFEKIELDHCINNSAFSDILRYSLPVYLFEEFDEYIESVSSFKALLRPKAIITATALWYDTGFRFYVAYVRHLANNIPLMLIQHGGCVGILKSDTVDYEESSADYYLTWGFRSNNKPLNNVRFGNPKKSANIKRIDTANKGNIVLVRSWYPRHVQLLFNEIDSDQAYFQDSVSFVTSISRKIRETRLLLRLYPEKRAYNSTISIGNNEKKYWESNFKNIEIDDTSDIQKIYGEASLVVYTYLMGTGYVECLLNNIPVIIISRFSDEMIRSEFQPISEKLKSCKVLFDDPIKAAKHVNEISEDVSKWWLQDDVQEAVSDFNNIYSFRPKKRIQHFRKVINNLIIGHKV